MCHREATWGKVRHDLSESPCLSGSPVGLCSHACPTKGPNRATFQSAISLGHLSAKSFLLSVFFYPSICTVMTFCYPYFVEEKKKDLLVVRPKIQTPRLVLLGPPCACVPSYAFGWPNPHFSPLRVLRLARAHKGPSENRPLLFLIVASLSSSVIMSAL